MKRRFAILTWGRSTPEGAKTACSVIRYRRDEVVAVLDPDNAGARCQDLLQTGGDLPMVATLAEATGADTLLIGIAPTGGRIPQHWRPVVLEAIERGMDVVSGLHDFMCNDAEFAAAAKQHNVQLIDVRKNNESTVARRQGLDESCFRVHTVGHDCNVGKMVTSVEITNELNRRGEDAKFIATGQTGILIEGDGCPIDCVTADFISGAAEQMVLKNQHRRVLVVEGQGSLVHPSYSSVTLGLLHGCLPHALILCYKAGRETVTGLPHLTIPPLPQIKTWFETMASIHQPCSVVGVAINGAALSDAAAVEEKQRISQELNLPACDVIRDGPGVLVDALMEFNRNRSR